MRFMLAGRYQITARVVIDLKPIDCNPGGFAGKGAELLLSVRAVGGSEGDPGVVGTHALDSGILNIVMITRV